MPDETLQTTLGSDAFARGWAHLCVDMQSVFAEETEWHASWLARILPAVEELAALSAHRTVFTRFIPPETVNAAQGAWRRYYRRWPGMVREKLPPGLLGLVPSLARFVPPARTFDKPVYSPWHSGQLHQTLRADGVETIVVSGGETDVCVLATVLGAIDLGYHVVLVTDAIFGSADPTHDAMLEIYHSRFQMQLSTTTVSDLALLLREAGL
ncbi:cysteine hydrolase family protein [Devosia sediminis]|uniref:cysteine hydrolase family protein n=1 Tax=Devosia sediminis TaxID=2798801 RepID=UPI0022A6737E|nr:cysteine hydrolase [Devosia sediminis]